MSAAISLVRQHDTQPAGLVFVDELPTKIKSGRYAAIAAALREQTGKWAVIKTFTYADRNRGWAFSNVVNSGKLTDFPKGVFEARTITDGDTTRVYVRHLPVVEVAR